MFGIICFKMIFTWLTPRVFAAMTKSLSFKVSVWARTILATPVQENRASISTRVTMLLGTKEKMTMIIRRLGTDWNISTIRIRIMSVFPPAYPLTAPTHVPAVTETTIVAKPTRRDTRLPYKARVKESRPSSSVPNQCSLLGPAILFITSM